MSVDDEKWLKAIWGLAGFNILYSSIWLNLLWLQTCLILTRARDDWLGEVFVRANVETTVGTADLMALNWTVGAALKTGVKVLDWTVGAALNIGVKVLDWTVGAALKTGVKVLDWTVGAALNIGVKVLDWTVGAALNTGIAETVGRPVGRSLGISDTVIVGIIVRKEVEGSDVGL